MSTLRLVGWRKGLKTVSLVQAVKDYSTGSLVEAKRIVDDLLAGEKVTLTFASDADRGVFLRLAEDLGALIE